MRKTKENGITLVALVITIIILLILAGITISQLTGSGLFENARLAEQKSTKEEMAESLTLALQELQLEKKGKATIADITQEWLDNKLNKYKCTIIEDAENNSKTITMEKDGITVGYELNKNLGVTSNEENVAGGNKFKIELTNTVVSTSTTATESDQPGLLTKGTAAYINFIPTIDVAGATYTISPELPYKVLGNGIYTFTVTVTHEGVTESQEVKVNVNQYGVPTGYVQYDAGNWTEKEIEELKSKSLYDINISKTLKSTYKLKDISGINFTFGGFTYKGDVTNSEIINKGTIITSRNQSVSSYMNNTEWIPKYDGWQILTTETKTDESGNVIKNVDGTDRTYVTKIIHAGSPENFVYKAIDQFDMRRMEYLLSNGERCQSYNILSDGTTVINPRNWDMYRDTELNKMGYIKQIHAITFKEATDITGSSGMVWDDLRNTGGTYWLATSSNSIYGMMLVGVNGDITQGVYDYCIGIRPVVEMNEGVYIASGDGTAASPYVLGKE